MTRRNWKTFNPRSLRDALEGCKDFAQERHNRSVERIAELAGEESHWTVYGWMRDGSIPGKKIPAFEHAGEQGIDEVVIAYLAMHLAFLVAGVEQEQVRPRVAGDAGQGVGGEVGFQVGAQPTAEVGAVVVGVPVGGRAAQAENAVGPRRLDDRKLLRIEKTQLDGIGDVAVALPDKQRRAGFKAHKRVAPAAHRLDPYRGQYQFQHEDQARGRHRAEQYLLRPGQPPDRLNASFDFTFHHGLPD